MHTVQVKRKRDQDPLQTLVVRAKRKRVDTVFRLAGTVDTQAQNDIVLANAGEGLFRLPPEPAAKAPAEDDIPPELKDMISDYIASTTGDEKPAPVAVDSPDAEVEDYVYDVYFSEHAGVGQSSSEKVGYIDVASDDERLLADEDESDVFDEEDDDSNAEDFYRNEYPDEEDPEDDSFGSDPLGDELDDALGDLKLSDSWSEDLE